MGEQLAIREDTMLTDQPVAGAAPATAPAAVHERPVAVRTLACVVTYEPDRDQLLELAMDLQAVPGLQIVFVDNSESETGTAEVNAVGRGLDIRVFCNPVNRGVGAAHNVGAELARRMGCDRLLLLDQDSRIPASAVLALHAALDFLQSTGRPVAAVGPALFDPRCGNWLPFVRLGAALRMRHVEHKDDELVPCDLLISSGSLIPLSALQKVGPLDEALFIEYVDVEWCLRARARGMRVFGVPAAVMQHTIGEIKVRRLGRWLPLHSPVRHYYAVRNALLFARKPYLSLRWRLHLITRALALFAIYAGTCAPRLERARWLGLGLWHGLIGRGGRLGGPQGTGARVPHDVPARAQASQASEDPDLVTVIRQ